MDMTDTKALADARECIAGHFDDNCEVCRDTLAVIDEALSQARGGQVTAASSLIGALRGAEFNPHTNPHGALQIMHSAADALQAAQERGGQVTENIAVALLDRHCGNHPTYRREEVLEVLQQTALSTPHPLENRPYTPVEIDGFTSTTRLQCSDEQLREVLEKYTHRMHGGTSYYSFEFLLKALREVSEGLSDITLAAILKKHDRRNLRCEPGQDYAKDDILAAMREASASRLSSPRAETGLDPVTVEVAIHEAEIMLEVLPESDYRVRQAFEVCLKALRALAPPPQTNTNGTGCKWCDRGVYREILFDYAWPVHPSGETSSGSDDAPRWVRCTRAEGTAT